MKHIAKTVSRFLLLSLTLGCGVFSLSTKNHGWASVHADESVSYSEKVYTAADF